MERRRSKKNQIRIKNNDKIKVGYPTFFYEIDKNYCKFVKN